MKVAIFETEHFEGAFPVIKLFDLPGNEITVYTSPGTYERFNDLFGKDMPRYNWEVLPEGKRLAFFHSLYRRLKKNRPDVLYLNTISNNHLLFAMVLKRLRLNRVVMTVHDINCLFESKPGKGFRQKIIHRGKRNLIKWIHVFNVVSETLVSYLKQRTLRPISVVHGAVYEERNNTDPLTSLWRIVVPGSLDRRRRNYEEVFELAELLNNSKLNIEIALLGGFTDDYGRSVIARAREFREDSCKIRYYDTDVVHQAEFDRQMDECRLVYIPSVINTQICGDIPEVYGLTKSSGNIFDVIKHAKPFIAPAGLLIPPALETSCIKYKNCSEIVEVISRLQSNDSAYNALSKNAKNNSAHYTMEKVRERNSFLFEKETNS